jgi:hypothetical protein
MKFLLYIILIFSLDIFALHKFSLDELNTCLNIITYDQRQWIEIKDHVNKTSPEIKSLIDRQLFDIYQKELFFDCLNKYELAL